MIKSKTNNCAIKSQHTTHSQVKEMNQVEKMDAPLNPPFFLTSGAGRGGTKMEGEELQLGGACVCVRRSVCVCVAESTQGASPFLLQLSAAIYGNTYKLYAWAHVQQF